MNLDQPAIMQEGRVLVPLRGIFERLGAEVVYLPASRSIKATRDRTQVELVLGSRSALVDGRTVYLDVPAATYSGRTMVPLRFISEALGADVVWQSASRTVSITAAPPIAQNTPAPTEPAPVAQPRARLEIQSVLHSSTAPLRPGDQLQVTMLGDPDGQATFEVPGIFAEVQMQEVRPGRYEGSVTIPNNLSIERGTVVARLAGNGRESQMEANRSLSFALAQNNANTSGRNAYNLLPQANSTVTESRPNIEMQFDRQVYRQTLRMLVDGQDVTRATNLYGNQLRYRPSVDLNSGLHQVYVSAQDSSGNSIRQQWSFYVDAYANNNNNNNYYYYSDLQLINLRDGMSVDHVFNVQGRTAPYANVRVSVQSSRALIPGLLDIGGPRLQGQGQADADGNFNIQIDASSLGSNTTLALVVESTDSAGRSPTPLNLDLTLR
ncbi:MAG: copper amine oxidase N-terminal domain-containing protein [Vulcanimicrobiota bacterium]